MREKKCLVIREPDTLELHHQLNRDPETDGLKRREHLLRQTTCDQLPFEAQHMHAPGMAESISSKSDVERDCPITVEGDDVDGRLSGYCL